MKKGWPASRWIEKRGKKSGKREWIAIKRVGS